MNNNEREPLASRMRPVNITELIGQSHLLSDGKPLRVAIENKRLHSMILWGPPGCGKTTLAKLLMNNLDANIEIMSAVLSGVKDIREVIANAIKTYENSGQKTVLFVDEVHHFNTSQQDAFLPPIENGTLLLIGATTENPSFALNNALLSRARVYVLEPLKEVIAHAAEGDARSLLNILEVISEYADKTSCTLCVTESMVENALQQSIKRFDKKGDAFYHQISALHKSVRGSSPDAALYWFARMILGGCDPLYIARRLIRMASEDIGNADPRALEIALNAWNVQERLGSPEGELAIAQAIVYLAVAAKSNAVYTAFNHAMQDAKAYGLAEVPLHLRNASSALTTQLGYGSGYRYVHDEPHAYAACESYFPTSLKGKRYYHPTDRGLEKKIQDKLAFLRELDALSS